MSFRRHNEAHFHDRRDAGRQLADRLVEEDLEDNVVVLGLPRGGVPVAAEVAAAIHAPLDVLVVRKLGAPSNPELAIGAIASGGLIVRNEAYLSQLGITEEALEQIRQRESGELERRERAYRGSRAPLDLTDKTAVLVDDGIATGATMHVAILAARRLGAARVVIAVPTSAIDARAMLRRYADRIIALSTPEPYYAVGAWYDEFEQLSDDDVTSLLARDASPKSRTAR